jgi:hypothetical protein
VTVPEHVVRREFSEETVVLNLETGKYHGLNPTAGHMLDVLERVASIRDAAAQLATEYGRPLPEIEQDLATLCLELAERGLIQLVFDEHRR